MSEQDRKQEMLEMGFEILTGHIEIFTGISEAGKRIVTFKFDDADGNLMEVMEGLGLLEYAKSELMMRASGQCDDEDCTCND